LRETDGIIPALSRLSTDDRGRVTSLVSPAEGGGMMPLATAELITRGYCKMQAELHARPKGYGGKGRKWAPAVAALVKRFDVWSVLDYGCGQGTLGEALRALVPSAVDVRDYDPAIPELSALPGFADLVVCTDVLEHVEPELLETVLTHLRSLARKAVFVVIATRPSNKTLSDGRNAHLIVEPADWWIDRLMWAGFTVLPDPPVSPLLKPSREVVAVLQP
jgi:hypothetical protein